MKRFIFLLLVLLFSVIILFEFERASQIRELKNQLATEKYLRETEKEKFEKELRLIKTDIDLLQRGYDDGQTEE